jgi:hypothetical protein
MSDIMPYRRLFLALILFIFLFCAGYFIIKPAFHYLSGYLSKNEQVNANILIVEGWLPEYAIETINNEFKKNRYEYIITTGLKSTGDYYMLSMNGYLTFYPGSRFSLSTESAPHQIEISAYSELGGKNRAHFNVFVNDSLVSDFLASKKKQNFLVKWQGELIKIDSIMVQFDNDKTGDFGDRNLYVNEITIDHKITIPYLNNSVYDISGQDEKRRIINNFSSNAELARNRLLSTGIDSSIIISVPANRVYINRTLTSALAVRDWLKKSDIKIVGINIISEGTHARRTWMTYNKVLNETYKIGIISLPEKVNARSHLGRLTYTFRQSVALVYYWLILSLISL